MKPGGRGAITIKEVAAQCELSLATVSYALRNSAKIPRVTRDRVRAAAQRLGYRPNPRIATLMAHIRRANGRPYREPIAFVWVHTTRERAASDPFLRKVREGARQRAEELGFVLEEFWPDEAGMTYPRLQQILRTRNIVGAVLSPVTQENTVTVDLDWRALASAVVGAVTWTPELHHAGHHHYLGMRTTLLELQRLGRVRPAALLDVETNERAKRAWEAAFLTHHPDRRAARSCLRLTGAADRPRALAAWLRRSGADALIVSSTSLLDRAQLRAVCREAGLPAATLHWNNETSDIGGIDQGYDRIAAHAVDLVAAQLHSNESGIPDLPRMMLFPGQWIAPRLPRAARRPRAASV